MHRFFLNKEQINDGLVTFPDAISRQIRRVLRMDVKKDAVIVLDNSGWEYLVQMDGLKGNQLLGHIVSEQEGRPEPALEITLCFSQSKREKVEFVLQKCTEIGVARFLPFVSSRTLVQDRQGGNNSARRERYESIIREAAEQSRRSRLPELMSPLSFEGMLKETNDAELRLIAWEGTPLVRHLCSDTLKGLPGLGRKTVALLIGPEGGFNADEVALAESYGYQQFSLGINILRMETACMAGSVILTNMALDLKD